MSIFRRTAVTALAVLALTACGTAGEQSPEGAEPTAAQGELVIVNNSLNTVAVYLVYQDEQFLVAEEVDPGMSDSTAVPGSIRPNGAIRALVDPVNASASTFAYLSDPIQYFGNQRYVLTISDDPALTTFIAAERRPWD